LGKKIYVPSIKEIERRLNEILKQMSNTEIRRKKDEKEII